MADQWHYKRGDRQSGPVSAQELKRLASAGDLLPSDMVRKESMAGWVSASQVRGLFASPLPADEMPPPVPASSELPPPVPSSSDFPPPVPSSSEPPSRIPVSHSPSRSFLTPRRFVIAAMVIVAVVALGAAWKSFGSSKSGLREQMAGEWVCSECTIRFAGDDVILTEPRGRALKASYSIVPSSNKATFRAPNSDMTLTVTLLNSNEMQMESPEHPGEVIVLRRKPADGGDAATAANAASRDRSRRGRALPSGDANAGWGGNSLIKGGDWNANSLLNKGRSSAKAPETADGSGKPRLNFEEQLRYNDRRRGELLNGAPVTSAFDEQLLSDIPPEKRPRPRASSDVAGRAAQAGISVKQMETLDKMKAEGDAVRQKLDHLYETDPAARQGLDKSARQFMELQEKARNRSK